VSSEVSDSVTELFSPENRMIVACRMLMEVQGDIYAGRYSDLGRLNITSVQLVLSLPADELMEMTSDFLKYIEAFRASGAKSTELVRG